MQESLEKANKVNKAIHAHNVLVKQARRSVIGNSNRLNPYLSVIVADEGG